MIKELKVYISGSFDVYENLALEKHLFDNITSGEYILYLWQNKSTVVIGRNQNAYAEVNELFAKQENICVSRRLSGGGAVFHDLGNLNFTFIAHKENYDLEKNMQVMKEACKKAGIDAVISGRNDILVMDKKFSGNAFFNSADTVYHHGTIMIHSDINKMTQVLTPHKAKLVSKGIKSVKSRVINLCDISPTLTIDDMRKYMISSFESVFGQTASCLKAPDPSELASLAALYATPTYIYGSNTPFSFSNEGAFTWGRLEIQLEIKENHIIDIKIFTDSLNWELADVLKTILTGCKFEYDEVSNSLFSALENPIATDILSLLF